MSMFRLAVVVGAAALVAAEGAAALSPERDAQAREVAARAVGYLRAQQDAESGGWAVNPQRPDFPAIAGLVVTGLLMDPRIDGDDEAVRRGVAYILSHAKPDGGLHDGVLPSYNTAICVSALARLHTPEAAAAVQRGVARLRTLQWGAFDPLTSPTPEAPDWNQPVDERHPFYGGVGYGNNGRPDLSNTQFFLQALQDAGVSAEDEALQRALVFLRRTQMDGEVNSEAYAQGSRQGGFIYATVPNAESIDNRPGQSQAGVFEETLDDGTAVSRLRAYGSMTYAGFKSLVYADLPRSDPRVVSALRWIERNYTLAENPGLGHDGYYYYLLTLARALDAWGDSTLRLTGPEGEPLRDADWADELVARLAELQEPDGRFQTLSSRWLEDNTALTTAYALIALQHARGQD